MINILKLAAEEGGKVLTSYFQQETLDISNKTSHQNIVTQADLDAQQKIKETILTAMKNEGINEDEIGFIGEEKLHAVGTHTFIIDPLDGTSNFATGMDEFAVLIAYFYNNELQSGVMYFPLKNEWYIAEKGKGAYAVKNDGKHILKSMGRDLTSSFILSSISYDHDIKSDILTKIMNLKKSFRGVRMIGSAASDIAFLADNIAGCIVLAGCSIWDIAPGKLILKEAGFEMYDFEGNEVNFELEKPTRTYPFFACDPTHKEDILRNLHKKES